MQDDSRYDQPTVSLTNWTPLHPGGYNYRSHELRLVSPGRIEYRATKIANAIGAGLVILGIAPLVIFAAPALSSGNAEFSNPSIGVPCLFFLLFGGFGSMSYITGARPITFDKAMGYFWKGWRTPDPLHNDGGTKMGVTLGSIRALQLIRKTVSGGGDGGSFSCHELNLVLNNSDRINLLSHADLNSMSGEASRLADFLGVPIWADNETPRS